MLYLLSSLSILIPSILSYSFGGLHHVQNYLTSGRTNSKYHQYHKLQYPDSTSTITSKITDPLPDQYFTAAIVDHFRPDNGGYWNQRYIVNDTAYGGQGYPIFLMIGGEGPISAADLDAANYMAYLATEHKALQVTLEHRYYGKSIPTTDLSTDNLKYLHSEQALADLVVFHEFFTNLYNATTSPYVVFGGSYPGCLTAWFRLKFPHLAVGAVASSAPVDTAIDFYKYMDVVDTSLKYYGGEKCTDAISQSVAQVEDLLQSADGRFKLKSYFNLCNDIVSNEDVATFQAQLMGNVQGVVQYSGDGGFSPLTTDLCNLVLNSTQDGPMAVLLALQNKYGGNPPGQCLDTSYKTSLISLGNVTHDWTQNGRQWTFQTCNQFGMFQTASGTNSFSGFKELNLAYYEQICSDLFGINRPPFADFSNNYYGATSIAGTNIIFPNGNIDPWHALGVINGTTLYQSSEYPVYIDGTAHCGDMFAPLPGDVPGLNAAHSVIANAVAGWLNDFYARN